MITELWTGSWAVLWGVGIIAWGLMFYAIIVYRRTREKMPAHESELEEALQEGVLVKWLSTIKHADEGKLVLERMELDDDGFPQPTGELEEQRRADVPEEPLGGRAADVVDRDPGLHLGEDLAVGAGADAGLHFVHLVARGRPRNHRTPPAAWAPGETRVSPGTIVRVRLGIRRRTSSLR